MFRRISVLLYLWCLPLWVSAASIRVVGPPILNLVDEDGQGVYQRLVTRALSGTDYQLNEAILPYRRAIDDFAQSRFDCIYSLTEVMQRTLGPEQVIYSYPLSSFRFYMFRPAGKAPLQSPDELHDLNVVGVFGHEAYYPEVVARLPSLIMVESDLQALEMLRRGRADVLLGVLPDLSEYVDELSFDAARPFFKGYDRITCHATPANRRFLEVLSQRLQAMDRAGEFQTFFTPH